MVVVVVYSLEALSGNDDVDDDDDKVDDDDDINSRCNPFSHCNSWITKHGKKLDVLEGSMASSDCNRRSNGLMRFILPR